MKNHKADNQESNGVNRRSFIAETIFAGAGLAALAVSQNQASAHSSRYQQECPLWEPHR